MGLLLSSVLNAAFKVLLEIIIKLEFRIQRNTKVGCFKPKMEFLRPYAKNDKLKGRLGVVYTMFAMLVS